MVCIRGYPLGGLFSGILDKNDSYPPSVFVDSIGFPEDITSLTPATPITASSLPKASSFAKYIFLTSDSVARLIDTKILGVGEIFVPVQLLRISGVARLH